MQERDAQFLVKERLNKYLRFFNLFSDNLQVKAEVTSLALEVVVSFQWLPGLIFGRVISGRDAQKDLVVFYLLFCQSWD